MKASMKGSISIDVVRSNDDGTVSQIEQTMLLVGTDNGWLTARQFQKAADWIQRLAIRYPEDDVKCDISVKEETK